MDELYSGGIQRPQPCVEDGFGERRERFWGGYWEVRSVVVAVFDAATVGVTCDDDVVDFEVLYGV